MGNDMKKNWMLLNNILGKNVKTSHSEFVIDGVKTSDACIISKSFCKYFISYPQSIHDGIPISNHDFSNIIPLNNRSMVFMHSSDEEVEDIVGRIKKNGNLEDISMKFLKISLHYVTKHIKDLFNLCIQFGSYPDCLKVAQVTPIHKKNSRENICNYRPISVQSNLSKIFDNMFYNRIQSFFQTSSLLLENQYGFRKKKNTELATLDLVNKILPAIENKSYAICVFLDYKACFDTISRSILYRKLERYGVRGIALDLVKSYYENRKQYVAFNACKSDIMLQELGVVQGSKCGPLFFDIYSNEFSILCSNDKHILYADDTCLIYVSDDFQSLIHHVNRRLKLIVEWCNFNKICLNPSKSEFMVISNRKHALHPALRLHDEDLQLTNSFKYLGIHLDKDLKFQSQVDHINSKLSSFCGITYRIRNRLNLSAAKNMYYACVYSTMTYCMAVWGGAAICTHRCDRTIRLHKRIVKNLFTNHYDDATCIFKAAGILKFIDIYKLLVSIYMYKILELDLYPSLKNSLNLSIPDHRYQTRNRLDFNMPFIRVETMRINYKHQFTMIWNELSPQIKRQPTLSSFKAALIKSFIEEY